MTTKEAIKEFVEQEYAVSKDTSLIIFSRKSRDFSHGMDRPLLSPFMGLFVYLCIFLIIDIFLNNFFTHITQCAHIVTR